MELYLFGRGDRPVTEESETYLGLTPAQMRENGELVIALCDWCSAEADARYARLLIDGDDVDLAARPEDYERLSTRRQAHLDQAEAAEATQAEACRRFERFRLARVDRDLGRRIVAGKR